MPQPSHVNATLYVQVAPDWSPWAVVDGQPLLEGAKAVNMTQRRPAEQRGGTVLVKLTVRLPASAFLPLRPAAVVVIPDDMTVTAPIEVTAEDAAS